MVSGCYGGCWEGASREKSWKRVDFVGEKQVFKKAGAQKGRDRPSFCAPRAFKVCCPCAMFAARAGRLGHPWTLAFSRARRVFCSCTGHAIRPRCHSPSMDSALIPGGLRLPSMDRTPVPRGLRLPSMDRTLVPCGLRLPSMDIVRIPRALLGLSMDSRKGALILLCFDGFRASWACQVLETRETGSSGKRVPGLSAR